MRYDYEEPASFSPHLVRLFPRNTRYVRVERVHFETDASADTQYRHDMFDNEIARCFYPEKLPGLDFQLALDLELVERNPFHFLLESHALRLPFEYQPARPPCSPPISVRSPISPCRPSFPRRRLRGRLSRRS